VKLAASAAGLVYISTSGGKVWTKGSRPQSFLGLTVYLTTAAYSGDGSRLLAASSNGIYIYNGTGWSLTSAPIQPWVSIASSADGSRLVAAVGGANVFGSLYVSLNGG
jgi:hypothetical protein